MALGNIFSQTLTLVLFDRDLLYLLFSDLHYFCMQKTPSQKSQPNTPGDQKSKTPKKSVMKGGVVAEDTKDGHGPEAKGGKMVCTS